MIHAKYLDPYKASMVPVTLNEAEFLINGKDSFGPNDLLHGRLVSEIASLLDWQPCEGVPAEEVQSVLESFLASDAATISIETPIDENDN